jgi:hypothetical protein
MIYTAKTNIFTGEYVVAEGRYIRQRVSDEQALAISMEDIQKGSMARVSNGLVRRYSPPTIIGRLNDGERPENSVEF